MGLDTYVQNLSLYSTHGNLVEKKIVLQAEQIISTSLKMVFIFSVTLQPRTGPVQGQNRDGFAVIGKFSYFFIRFLN